MGGWGLKDAGCCEVEQPSSVRWMGWGWVGGVLGWGLKDVDAVRLCGHHRWGWVGSWSGAATGALFVTKRCKACRSEKRMTFFQSIFMSETTLSLWRGAHFGKFSRPVCFRRVVCDAQPFRLGSDRMHSGNVFDRGLSTECLAGRGSTFIWNVDL